MLDRRRKIFASLVAVLLIVLISLAVVTVRQQGVYEPVTKLNHGWTLIYHGDTTQIQSTETYAITDKVVRGDSLILRRTLTNEIPYNPVLRFKTYQSFVEAYRDGNKIYSNGEKNYKEHKLVGSGIHFVYLGISIVEGKTLELKFYFSEDDIWNVLPSFEVLPSNYAFGDFYARHSIALVIGLFLVLFGILALFLSAGMIFYRMKFFQIMMIGFLSICLGIWTLCFTKVFQLFSYNLAFNTSLEYSCLYISPLPLYLLLLHMRYKQIGKILWRGLITVASIGILIFVTTSILNYTDIVHFPQSLWVFHAYVILCVVYLFAAVISKKNLLDTPTKFLAAGIFTFGAFSILELIRFNVMTLFRLEHTMLGITWLPLGTLSFIILLVMSYIVYTYRLMSAKTEKDVLKEIAYRDSLTGIYNRAKCQQIFDILDSSTADFAIVSIDMNGLKLVNDRYGHHEGDQLIKAFAMSFHDAFAEIGTSIRMGGDEFLAIIRVEHIDEVEVALAKMKVFQERNSKKLLTPLEAAYGVAYRHEFSNSTNTNSENTELADSEKVYQLADERMYAMKSVMKSTLVRK
ncbi:GGDEF domain-containing protein [Fibrobacter sp. UWB12]|uniref:GGDEF domain-containing protein n=1 Tax=Fibrobacter sp. UWB12 TaxID=1896203 RepID=UPI00091AA2FA|nr:GGDEF domain-containing protein [Fibrobacter sp. UWB12]SHK70599.1 diguanylate cyclase (GGDEF) domain-containing protein [Fibrobacter sp. UWB12]